MKLVAFQQFGYNYQLANKIYVIREIDLDNNIMLDEILSIMGDIGTDVVDDFFEKSKMCFLTNSDLYDKLLEKLSKRCLENEGRN